MNTIILSGRLCKDPIIRYSKETKEVSVAEYTLAVRRTTNNKSGTEVDFLKCYAYNNHAVNAERFLHKGDALTVKGTLQIFSFESEGKKINYPVVIVDEQDFRFQKSITAVTENTSSETEKVDSDSEFMAINDMDESEFPWN